MLEILLAFFGNVFAKIFSEVAKDVLKTPAKEIEVTEVRGDVDVPPTPVDELLADYGM
jgi:hypothetical protein